MKLCLFFEPYVSPRGRLLSVRPAYHLHSQLYLSEKMDRNFQLKKLGLDSLSHGKLPPSARLGEHFNSLFSRGNQFFSHFNTRSIYENLNTKTMQSESLA